FPVLAAAAVLALAVGAVTIKQTTGDWNVPLTVAAGASLRGQGGALLAGAVLLVVAASVHVRSRAPGAPLVAGAAFVAVRASLLLRSHGDAAPVAIGLGVMAALVALGR